MKSFNVVAAVIVNNNEILCMQRNTSMYEYISMKWEFPGGKMEDNETEEDALKREIKEELNLEINVKKKIITVKHEYPDFKLVMHTYRCECITNDITLNEHVAYKWLPVKNLGELDWAEADLPIVEKLMSN